MTAVLGLAFLTGMLATVNPCGFAMLPTYLAYFIGSGPGAGRKRPLLAGLRAGVALSAGFATVFVTAGLLAAVGLRSVASALPWAAALIGAVIVAAGLGMVFGWQLPGTRLNLPRTLKTDGARSGLRAVFGYGVAYAVAALSCSLALLLAVVAQAVSTGSLVGLLAVFAAYALGSSVVLVLLSLGAAVARDALARHVRKLLPFFNRLGGAALVLAGIYLLLYWVPALSGGQAGGIMSGAVTEASAALSGFISGNWPIITSAAVAAVLSAVALSLRRRRDNKAQDHSGLTDINDSPESCCGPEPLLPYTAPGRNNQQGNP
ncbi:cytochrome c biogenesis CcdA family protein [Arthrobacter sp. UNC362MFTsu5.1]|uniref:cytochrome c biogenesis CcdA family protein n=1 Tax=Arthrobacter sp. UNC362MFTsu5.1 TaxID=1449044 RepID=UPI00048804DC|nr:cytochrome c biogenesis protein CcdA [Arthrobacter sp. UNC362MFTsu5.1]